MKDSYLFDSAPSTWPAGCVCVDDEKSRFECSPQGAHVLTEKSMIDLFGTGDGYRRYFVGTLALAPRSSASPMDAYV